MPQDIVWGDSPELAAAAWTLGNPHPTGYSLYMLLLHFTQWLPFGTIAFRSHLFSAVSMSLAGSLWMIVLSRLLSCTYINKEAIHIASAASTIAFALTPIAWSQAIITEVYAFFILLCAVNAFILISAWQPPRESVLPMLMISTLQLIHHRMAIFFVAVAFLLWLYRCITVPNQKPLSMTKLAVHIVMGLSPLLLLLYFPIRAASDPFLNWVDPSNLTNFLAYINGEMYKQILDNGITYSSVLLAPKEFSRHLIISFGVFSWLGLFILFGWYVLFKQHYKLGFVITPLFIIYLLFVMLYKVGDWQVFLLPLLLIQSIPLAFGFIQLLVWIKQYSSIYFIRFSYGLCILLAFAPLFITSDVELISRSLANPMNKRELQFRFGLIHDLSASIYGQKVYNTVQPGDTIITGLEQASNDNEFFPLVYQHLAEKRAPDSPLIGANFLLYDWYRIQVNERYGLNIQMNQDTLYTSRQAMLNDVWQQVMVPLFEHGSIITPSPKLPANWYSIAEIEDYDITTPRPVVLQSYKFFLPGTYAQRITLKSE